MKIITTLFNRQILGNTDVPHDRSVIYITRGNYRQINDGFEFRWYEHSTHHSKYVSTFKELKEFERKHAIRIELQLY